MPNIQFNKQGGGKITWGREEWLGSFDTLRGGQDLRVYGPGLALSDAVDPLRHYGFIAPGFDALDATNDDQITGGPLLNGVVNSTSAFAIGGGRVHKIDSIATGTPTINETAPFPHDIDHSHASEEADDCVVYYTGTTKRLFYSFNDATDWDVGIYNFVADTFDDDFMSTAPASPLAGPYLTEGAGFPHPIEVGDDDIAYIGDRNFVHAYDGQTGATGTFSPAVLTLPVGWVITAFAKTNDYKLVVFAYKAPSTSGQPSTFFRSESKAWFWDYLSLDPDFSLDLHDNYVSEAVNWNGLISCFTEGRDSSKDEGDQKLQALVDGRFKILQTYKGSLPRRGGVEPVGDDLYWNGGGKVYGYQKVPFENRFIFNHTQDVDGSSSGMLKLFVGGFRLFVSSGITTTGGLQLLSSNYSGASRAYGKYAVPGWAEGKRGRIKKVTVTLYQPVTGGRSLSMDFATVGDNYELFEILAETSTFVDNQLTIHQRPTGAVFGDFEKVQPILRWTTGSGAVKCPEVEKIEIDFDTIDILNT